MLEIEQPMIDALQRSDAGLIDELARAQIGRHTLGHGAIAMVLQGLTTADEAMTIAE
jgi:hypothetical protein